MKLAFVYYSFFYRIGFYWIIFFVVLLNSVNDLHAKPLFNKANISLPFHYIFSDQMIQSGYELLLEGENKTKSYVTLIVRIDNQASKDYRSRFNKELSIAPGKFTFHLPLTGLKNSKKEPLLQPYKKMIIFTANDEKVLLNKSVIQPPPVRSKDVLALDFGKRDSPVFPGFEKVLAKDPRIKGQVSTRYRTSGDALIQDGVEGIQQFSMPWENGKWRLTLWLQDQGEWEYLPHPLNQTILVQDQIITTIKKTPRQWIENVYLKGMKKEAILDGDLWQVVGQRRLGVLSIPIEITSNQLNIKWQGDRAAQYISGLVLEPMVSDFSQQIRKKQKQRFIAKWPVIKPINQPVKQLMIQDISKQNFHYTNQQKIYSVAKDTRLNLTFQIKTNRTDPFPIVVISHPKNSQGDRLNYQMRYGHWQYEKLNPQDANLMVDDSLLRSDMTNMTLSNQLPRNIYLQVVIPKKAVAGIYQSHLQIMSFGKLYTKAFKIEVLPIELPRLKQSIGLYLEPAPFYQWFPVIKSDQKTATACDMNLLSSLGFSNIAPFFSTPTNVNNTQLLIDQIKQAKLYNFHQPMLAYSPLKRLQISQKKSLLSVLTQIKNAFVLSKVVAPYWSIFDEPHQENFYQIKKTATMLHDQLQFKTAGHFNNPRQKELMNFVDLAIVNHGFGVDKQTIQFWKKNKKVWLYNMPHPRLAAGLYVWFLKVDGYLQWHGRMPTADPFDPTDGREGDVMYIYPWQGACPKELNIHKKLLSLHEATLDLRWLNWLDDASKKYPIANQLRIEIEKMIANQWEKAQKQLTEEKLLSIRQSIVELVKQIK